MSRDDDWQVLQYVLDDPTLDRAAFESQMLDDCELALAVARAVDDVASLQLMLSLTPVAAHQGASRVEVRRQAVESVGWHWSGLAALAAALLLAVGFGLHQLETYRSSDGSSLASHRASDPRPLSQPTNAPQSASEHFVADYWLAMHREALSSDSLEASESLLSGDDVREPASWLNGENLPATAELSEDEDWMIEAAREFYAQGVAG